MRSRMAAFALTLMVGLGGVGLVSADESGSWFTRIFNSPSRAKGDKNESGKDSASKGDLPPTQPSAAKRARQAKADLERRQDVCLKLREFALANGDEDTLAKVDRLEQRAYDLYLAATNAKTATATVTDVNAKKGDR